MDTSAWIGLMDDRDQFHAVAIRFQRTIVGARRIITWGILAETHTFLRYHRGVQLSERWLNEVIALEQDGLMEIIYPTESMTSGIRRELSRFPDQDLSYVDAFTLFTIRTRPAIDAIFAFDHHMALAGVPVLPQ